LNKLLKLLERGNIRMRRRLQRRRGRRRQERDLCWRSGNWRKRRENFVLWGKPIDPTTAFEEIKDSSRLIDI